MHMHLFTFFLAVNTFAGESSTGLKDVKDLPLGTGFEFNMEKIAADQCKQKTNLIVGGRDGSMTYFVNGKIQCSPPLFERYCFILNTSLPSIDKIESKKIECQLSDNVKLVNYAFEFNGCPIEGIHCNLNFGRFTDDGISEESLKRNLGSYIKVSSEKSGNSSNDKSIQDTSRSSQKDPALPASKSRPVKDDGATKQ